MLLRKFIISLVTKYNGEGFKKAEDDARKLARTAERASTSTEKLGRSTGSAGRAATKAAASERQLARDTERAAKAAERAAAARAKEAARTERDFMRAVSSAERALEREAAAKRKAAEKAERDAAKAAAADKRHLDKLRRQRERAELENRRSREKIAERRKRDHQKMVDDDAKAYLARKRQRLADLKDEAAARDRRRAIFKSTASELRGIAATAGRVAMVGAAGVAALGAAVISTGASFESLRAQLKTVEGSSERAAASFSLIQDFATKTPFQVDELTRGFVALRVRGVHPTTEMLTGLGDLAAAFGYQFEQVTEAIAAAARGELDPIEKFGIGAKIVDDKIRLTFKDQVVEIERSAEAVTQALVAFGQMEGVQGAMAEQSKTANGMLSNLADGVQSFMDTVAQMGVLDAFKSLLGDVAAQFDESEGFARVLADALIVAIEAIRSFVANVSPEDLSGALNAFYEAVVAGANAVQWLIEAMKKFVAASGGMEEALGNLALLIGAATLALTGPVGLVAAVGLVGAAMGRFIANAIADWNGLNDEIAKTRAEIKEIEAEIAKIKQERREIEDEIDETQRFYEQQRRDRENEAKEIIRSTGIDSLGAGLGKEVDEFGVEGRAAYIRGAREGNDFALSQLVTDEGKVVLNAVLEAEKKRGEKAVENARREARKSGRDEEAAAQAALQAVNASNRQSRAAAFEAATATFAETGSAEAAAEAAVAKVGKVKGAAKPKKGGKGGKGDQFFEFDKEVARAAKQQAEEFAQRELERLIAMGTDPDEAIALARQAGRQRAKELEEKFKQAGKVFDASSKNILDILGLRGPGSVLENRPPPQSLVITIAPTIKLIERLEIQIQGAATNQERTALEDAANQARDALLAKLENLPELVSAMFELQGRRLLAANGLSIAGVQ